MDKNMLQILSEVTGFSAKFLSEKQDLVHIRICDVFEAMKIFGKQAYVAGRIYQTLKFDEWFNKLEEKNG